WDDHQSRWKPGASRPGFHPDRNRTTPDSVGFYRLRRSGYVPRATPARRGARSTAAPGARRRRVRGAEDGTARLHPPARPHRTRRAERWGPPDPGDPETATGGG